MKKAIKICVIIGLVLFILGSLFLIFYINDIMGISKVKFNKEKLIAVNNEIVVFNNNEEKLQNKVSGKNIVSIEEIPNNVINAFISIEDKDFFKHNGLNYKRILKAAFINLKSFSFKEGASTISQQLIKNTHLSNEKTISRKLNEMMLTKKLEKQFSKKDILETYLNVIYFGENSYGIEQASNNYFNKSTKDLTLWEGATLAGIIKSPYNYSPIYNAENCLNRRNLVLKEMLKDKKITQAHYDEAVNKPLEIIKPEISDNVNSLYIQACLNEAQEILNLSEKDLRISGIKIYSYLDDKAQNELFTIANNENNYHINSFGNTNDSLLILIDNENYSVVGFAGKSDYDLTNFVRQPGSAIKPILVYAPALEKGLISPDTLILDEPVNYGGYAPTNLNGVNYGYVSVEKSIGESLNIPAVKTLDYVGINNAKNFAENAGINFDKNDNGLAIALGGFTNGVSLKELTNSYLPFVNDGKFADVKFIKKIVDANGKTIYERKVSEKQIMGEDTAYLMTDMLKEACKSGTSMKLKILDFDVAGKTGTVAIKGTNLNTDAYSIAYTTKHTMGVWIGNYSNNKEFVLEGKNNGGTYATNMIKTAFSHIYENEKPKNFEAPNTVCEVEVDLKEYENNHLIKLASVNCPERYKFKSLVSKRYIPKETSNLFENLAVENFDVKLENNAVKISFSAEDYLKYEIMRVENGVTKSLKKYSNKNGDINYYDTNLKDDTKYNYYIKISTINDSATSVSETLSILTESKQNKINNLFNKQDNLSWLFN